MSLRFHNTLTKRLEDFEPIEPGKVRMYNCGPTVYDSPHVGNFRTFAFADTLRRYLEYKGFEVRQVMNLTDVGHLTRDDVEAGPDKMEVGLKRLREQGINVENPYQVADHFIDEYFAARKSLGFLSPHVSPRATEHVPEMIEMIQSIIAKGLAYVVNGNVYFEVSRFPNYGRLSGNTVEELVAGARVEVHPEKRHPADFALWKTDPGHLMQFDSPWGRGFPGWHIECSAMSKKHLGETLDIHTGGEDNIFPHHDCEIAQSETANGRPFVRYWLHARHLLWNGKKMSKSEGTFFTIEDLIRQGFPGKVVRHCLVSTHYRQQVNYSMDSFKSAAASLARIEECRRRLSAAYLAQANGAQTLDSVLEVARASFETSLDDDLNTSGGLGAVHELVREVNRALDAGNVSHQSLGAARGQLDRFCDVLGVPAEGGSAPPPEVTHLADERRRAREARNWAESDRLRDEIRKRGWIVEDGKTGQTLKPLA